MKKESFSWEKGDPTRYQTDTEAWCTFCQDCGSSLTYESPTKPDDLDVTTGSLNHPEDFPPSEDAYLKYRIPWVSTVQQKEIEHN